MLFYAHEKKGIVVLLVLIAGLVILPRQFLNRELDLFLLPEVKDTVELTGTGQKIRAAGLTPKQFELNTVDSSTLTMIKGIGPYFAHRIIKYRQQLGGYYSVSQLKELEIKHFDANQFIPLFTTTPGLIARKELNTMAFKEILRHPYLDYDDVKCILEAKNKYGKVSFRLLKDQKILPDDKLEKIKHYFR